ncbi:MAG: beta-galactosidase trimerization domain-containing protein [Chloroflexota bacterium]|nr:beta-galactosidase trimerization domain-containing protein [Chloroflexota bacterium]
MSNAAVEWWRQPFRVFQTNIREIDSGLDVQQNVKDILDFGCNVWLLNAGGIVSHYPSRLPHQHPSPWLKDRPSGNLVGDAVEVAHANGLRLIARCDFSKLHRDQFERHPDWFYVSPTGERQLYNGLYSTCPSAPYYQEKSFEVFGELLDTFPIDGLFINWFLHPLRDYSGNRYGVCQCVSCQRKFADFSGGLPLPQQQSYAEPTYRVWQRFAEHVLSDLAGRLREFIKTRRPSACLLLKENPDVVDKEVNNAVDRPLPLWRYDTGDAVRTLAATYPDRPVSVRTVLFLDIPYRFSAEQPGLIGLELAQTLANNAVPYAYVLGHTRNQPDRKNFPIVRQMMRFHHQNERWYTGLRSLADILLIAPQQSEIAFGDEGLLAVQAAYRGAYRALVESHIPFDVLPDHKLTTAHEDGRLARYKAIILPNAAALSDAQVTAIDSFVEQGGGLVATLETATRSADGAPRASGEIALQSLGAARLLALRAGPKELRGSYLRVTNRADLADLPDTDLVPVDRAFAYVEPRQGAVPSFTFVGPSVYGPPEKCWWDGTLETGHPGLLWRRYGQGQTAYLPWPVDALFYGHSLPECRSLIAHAVRSVAGSSQVQTDLPPQVEITIHQHSETGATLLHLVNGSGHQDRSFFDATPFFERHLAIRRDAPVRRVTSAMLERDLPFQHLDGRVHVTLPRLDLLDLLIFA